MPDFANTIDESDNDYLEGSSGPMIETGTERTKKLNPYWCQFKPLLLDNALVVPVTLWSCHPWFARFVKPSRNRDPGACPSRSKICPF